MVDTMFAFFLITGAPGSPVPDVGECRFNQIANHIRSEAVRIEIMDPREVNYISTRYADYKTDVELLRVRHEQLKDAPKVGMSMRLPTRDYANNACACNRQYYRHIQSRMELELDRRHLFLVVLGECDESYRIWDRVRDARCEYYYVQVRRRAMKELIELMGEEAYRELDFPSPWPEWRMDTIRR